MLRPLPFLFAVALSFAMAPSSLAVDLEAEEIVRQYIERENVDSELADLRLQRFRAGELVDDRPLVTMTCLQGTERSSILRAPSAEDREALALLFVDPRDAAPAIYRFRSSVGRTRRVSRRASEEPFLGSDFSLADLRREALAENRYSRLSDAMQNGTACFAIEAIPKNLERSAYRRRILYIAKAGHTLEKVEFFGKGDQAIKVFTAFGYGDAAVRGDTRRPRRAVMTDVRHGTETVLSVSQSSLEPKLDASLFTPRGIAAIDDDDVGRLRKELGFSDVELFGSAAPPGDSRRAD